MRARATPVGPNGRSPVPLVEDVLSEEERTAYLDHLRNGIGPDLAARAIDTTGTRMRRFLHRDPEWAAQVDAARKDGLEHYRDRLQATARALALSTDRPQPRILEVELATHVPGYEHLRRDRVKHEGHIEHGLVVRIDPGTLDELPVERLRELRATLAELGGEVVDGEARELPA